MNSRPQAEAQRTDAFPLPQDAGPGQTLRQERVRGEPLAQQRLQRLRVGAAAALLHALYRITRLCPAIAKDGRKRTQWRRSYRRREEGLSK